MTIFHLILLISFSVFIISAVIIFIRVLFNNKTKEYSEPKGKTGSSITYSFSGAMSPFRKESAYLHLPTYTAGMIFHIGTFISILYLVLLFFNIPVNAWILNASVLIISASAVCGISILIKRIVKINLRNLSSPDDYLSNMLVTGFQICTVLTLLQYPIHDTHYTLLPTPYSLLFLYSSLMFLYIPIGKLRHSIYFFSSRIYLGLFYGRRGVWK